MENDRIKKIIAAFAAIAAVAAAGSIFVNLGMDWYGTLEKPAQWAPNIVIPIVWTVIYISFAAIDFVWLKTADIPRRTAILMAINGALNVLWCLTFFTLKLLFVGNIVIIINLIAAFLLIVDIYREKKLFGYILSIYPVWLAIATTLNLAVWILN